MKRAGSLVPPLLLLLTFGGCGPPPDPAVGRWYGRVLDPAAGADEMMAELQEQGQELPPRETVIGLLEEARYTLNLEADGSGTFNDTSCTWVRQDDRVLVDVAGDEQLTLTSDGHYLYGNGYVFAPHPR